MSDAPDNVPVEIEAEALSKSFEEHAVLREINLAVHAGELVCIVGGSGSGKTVLLDMLIGLMEPTGGRVLAADHNAPPDPASRPPTKDLAKCSDEELDLIRLHWAVVFQRNALFSGNVRENIDFWLREHTELDDEAIEKRIRESLSAVALDVNDVIDKDRDALSGGMAKRVAIARAIACDPLVMFYDEPTTGLDPIVSGTVHELIFNTHNSPLGEGFAFRDLDGAKPAGRASAKRTTIVVTHDRDLLRRIEPRVVMLDNAAICFDGPYADFGESSCAAAKAYLAKMPVLHEREPHRGRRDQSFL